MSGCKSMENAPSSPAFARATRSVSPTHNAVTTVVMNTHPPVCQVARILPPTLQLGPYSSQRTGHQSTGGNRMQSIKALRTLVWAAGVAAVAAFSIVPAQAADSGPVVFEVHLARTGVYASCDSFAVKFVANIDAHYEQFFNDSRQLVLERRHVQFTGTLTNATTGASLPYEGNFTRTFDVASGTVTLIGERRKTEVSGQGVLA